ncbi:MAG: hypothetical protein ACMUIP_04570 [bacterium]
MLQDKIDTRKQITSSRLLFIIALLLPVIVSFLVCCSKKPNETNKRSLKHTDQLPLLCLCSVHTSNINLKDMAEDLTNTLAMQLSETGRFRMMPLLKPYKTDNKEYEVMPWDIAHSKWRKTYAHESNHGDLFAIPYLSHGGDYIIATLKMYDLQTGQTPVEIDSFSSISVDTANTYYLAYRLTELVRERYPLFPKIATIGSDGSLYIDKGARDGIRPNEIFIQRGGPICDPDGRILGYMPGKMQFRVIQVTAHTARLDVISPPDINLYQGLVLMSTVESNKNNEYEKKERIIVSPFRNLTKEDTFDPLVLSLSETLLGALVLPGIQPLERGSGLDAVVTELKRNTSALFNQETVVEQGRFMSTGAWMVNADLIRTGKDNYRVLASLINPETSEMYQSMAIDRDKPWDFIEAMSSLANAIQHIVAPHYELVQGVSLEKLMVDINVMPTIPTSIHHLLPKIGQAMVTYKITNRGTMPLAVKIRSAIDGWGRPVEETLNPVIRAGEVRVIQHNPLLLSEHMAKMNGAQKAHVVTTVEVLHQDRGWQRLMMKTHPVTVLSPDIMCWKIPSAFGHGIDCNLDRSLIAAWVSSDRPELAEVISTAKRRNAQVVLAGYHDARSRSLANMHTHYCFVENQIKALVETVCLTHTLTYVNQMYTDILPVNVAQRILFPEEALQRGTANCIDGVVLIASLMRRIGIDPLIIIRPHHAYLGWWTLPRWQLIHQLETHTVSDEMMGFLETIALSEDFSSAQKSGHNNAKHDRLYENLFGTEHKEHTFDLIHQLLEEGICEITDTRCDHVPIYILDIKTLKEKKQISQIPR